MRIDYYDSASDNASLRENYDELSLVFDNETKQWKGPLQDWEKEGIDVPAEVKAFRGSLED